MTEKIILPTIVTLVAASAQAAVADTVPIALRTAGHLQIVRRTVPEGVTPEHAAFGALAAGPTPVEQAAGVFSALPAGTRLLSVQTSPDNITVDFSSELLEAMARSDEILQQVQWTAIGLGLSQDIRVTIAGEPLSAYMAPPALLPRRPQGAGADGPLAVGLSGRKITVSPGHGYFWNGSTWNTQRPVYCAPLDQEDFHNLDICRYLEAYLVADGAIVKMARCTDKNFGNHSSGNPWWQMAAAPWLAQLGYPVTVYAPLTNVYPGTPGVDQTTEERRTRPEMSNYDGTDLYVSIHTNGYQGDCTGVYCPSGTDAYYDSTQLGGFGNQSYSLANQIQDNIKLAVNTYFLATFPCRNSCNPRDSAFTEIHYPLRPAALVELAFHDTCDTDAVYLRDNLFRSAAMYGVYKGICEFLGSTPTWAAYSSEYVGDTIPTRMDPGQTYNVSVTFRNRGVVWTTGKGFRLGAVGDSDPFTGFNRVDISGEVGPGETYTFSFGMTAPASPGTYTTDWRMVRDGDSWFGATLTRQVGVGPGPLIVQQPSPQSVCPGATAAFTVAATGQGTLTYQWQKDGADLADGGHYAGVRTATLTVSNAGSADAANYRCAVTDDEATTLSDQAALAIKAVTTVTQHPTGRTLCEGDTVDLSIAATGEGALSYRWRKNGVDLSDTGPYSGTGTATLRISNVSMADAADYQCLATADCGSVLSNTATLTVNTATLITQHPEARQVAAGGTAVFDVTASGSGSLSYQWQKDLANLIDDGRVSGATTPTLTIAGAGIADQGAYRCIVTGECGSAGSNEAVLTLIGASYGDFDIDADVDLADFAYFQMCFNGPNRSASQSGCAKVDHDADGDIDLTDFAAFQACFNGPNRPPACL